MALTLPRTRWVWLPLFLRTRFTTSGNPFGAGTNSRSGQ